MSGWVVFLILRGRGRDSSVWFPLTLVLGAWPATQAHALTGSRACDLLVPRLALNTLSPTSQVDLVIFEVLPVQENYPQGHEPHSRLGSHIPRYRNSAQPGHP